MTQALPESPSLHPTTLHLSVPMRTTTCKNLLPNLKCLRYLSTLTVPTESGMLTILPSPQHRPQVSLTGPRTRTPSPLSTPCTPPPSLQPYLPTTRRSTLTPKAVHSIRGQVFSTVKGPGTGEPSPSYQITLR